MKLKSGSAIASAVAGMFLAGTVLSLVPAPAQAAVEGVCKAKNSCKAKGDCGVPGKHDCGGKNSCAGQGWVYIKSKGEKAMMTKEECDRIQGATWEVKKEEKKS